MKKEFDQPSSIEAEKAVLGGLLLEPELWDTVSVEVEEDDFMLVEHKLIYRSIRRLRDHGNEVDTVTLIESLTNDPDISSLSNFNQNEYIKKLASDTPGTANFLSYTDIVKQTSSLRKLISTASDISSIAKESDSFEIEGAFSEAENKLINLRDSIERKKGPVLAKDLIKPVYDNIEENLNSTTPLIGHSTGFRDLDKMTLGLQNGDLILVAGRPSMGKTAFGLSIAASFIENNIPSVFYSLEMSSRSVMYRIISILSKVELKRIFQAKELTDSDFEKIGKAVELIEKSNFFIDDTSALSPSEILSRSRKLKREQPELGLIVIDYLQLMKADQSNPSRVNEISEISRATKALAKELDIPVIALSQLNRASETRTNKVPILADMRDSGALEQDADLVIFPFRPEFHEPTPENKGIARIIVAKHRNGETGESLLHWAARYTSFENLAPNDPAYDNPAFSNKN
ncbi:replicative DNA helicase [SAR86 cluster bacterium]|jgi:replicative DNA helicase|nr:replicative DNA helicase [SAR86 cluster bacterium]URQ73138.1 replicative DNA helicase [SAR86 cluster bacterium]|tara:strand:+ start:1366 stop:2745 length:1380 start_codon:yes stop_codon:yes gene_type:complete